ncbi:Ribonucleotide reductase, transcriptional regulator CRT10 [Niveomyces insectorum RCEF 264]|uniref:Ribonucleotide reductase, transcriptional regulator CRT10 n=1 Tax=Niveomyces insectorum RCEF 264 TaxID=1081102 RepID=A0A162JG72_9HYPO|nr:Ribonucleotide reductase, transcriptional regulator CRT10 [Niveomyces insectorum RCEF 264]
MANQTTATSLPAVDSPAAHSTSDASTSTTPSSPASRPLPDAAASLRHRRFSAAMSRPAGQSSVNALQDVECVWVAPVCGVQTPENRFGPDARDRIYTVLHPTHSSGDEENDETETDDDDTDEQGNPGVSGDFVLSSHPLLAGNNHHLDIDLASNLDDGFADVTSARSWETDYVVSGVAPPTPSGTDGTAGHFPAAQPSSPTQQLPNPPIPRVARARVNLTALSQRYNLYFTVYQDKIFVYRPQPAPEILRGPLLILRPPASRAARLLGGYINFTFHHQANHILVGDLGDDEILLLAYDDGDVIAYYTQHIVSHIERRTRLQQRGTFGLPLVKPRPFFSETVGKTAWGLAIHAQSRLIAVSTNLAEVNVFAFALRPAKPADLHPYKTPTLTVPTDDASPTTWAGVSALELESQLRLRNRNWRILLPLGPNGHNIPSIDFIDDVDGNAEKVAAIDINGLLWILDIWKVGSLPLSLDPTPREHPIIRGWGVLVLPNKEFLKTRKMPGAPMEPGRNGQRYFDISRTINFSGGDETSEASSQLTGHSEDGSDNDSSIESTHEYAMLGDDSDVPSDEDGSSSMASGYDDWNDGSGSSVSTNGDANTNLPGRAKTVKLGSQPFRRDWDALVQPNPPIWKPAAIDFKQDANAAFRMGMIICPSLGLTWSNLSVTGLIGTLKNSRYRLEHSRELSLSRSVLPSYHEYYDMADRFSILRTFDTSIELLDTDVCVPSALFRNVPKPPTALPFTLWDMQRDFHRCSLLQHVPEISLVVVGNMFGRVALLRPVKMNLRSTQPSLVVPQRSFRVEHVLPRLPEEERGLRPPCCLLGIAVSRIPEPCAGQYQLFNTKKRTEAKIPRRWRLILHYMDHTVLQYYIEEKKRECGDFDLHFG